MMGAGGSARLMSCRMERRTVGLVWLVGLSPACLWGSCTYCWNGHVVFWVSRLCGWSRQPPAIHQLAHLSRSSFFSPTEPIPLRIRLLHTNWGLHSRYQRGETLYQGLHSQLCSLLEPQGPRGGSEVGFSVRAAIKSPCVPSWKWLGQLGLIFIFPCLCVFREKEVGMGPAGREPGQREDSQTHRREAIVSCLWLLE